MENIKLCTVSSRLLNPSRRVCNKTIQLVALFLILGLKSFSQTDQSPTLTKLTYTFFTTTNDKDWNTQVGAQIYIDGHVIAEKFCCSSDRPHGSHDGDHWKDRTQQPTMDLPISEKIGKNRLDQAVYKVSIKAVGNDQWDFDARLHAEFSDGTQRNWTFLTNSLDSRGSNRVEKDFRLSDKKYQK